MLSSIGRFPVRSTLASPSNGIDRSGQRYPPIDDLTSQMMEVEPLLRSFVGADITFTMICLPARLAVAMDWEVLVRMLFNLIANAVESLYLKHGVTGRRVIRITMHYGDGMYGPPRFRSAGGPSGTVVISVRDNGIGTASEGNSNQSYVAASTLGRHLRGSRSYLYEKDDSGESEGKASDGQESPEVRMREALLRVRGLAEAAGGGIRVVSMANMGTRVDVEVPYW
jgi:hypothetical protein